MEKSSVRGLTSLALLLAVSVAPIACQTSKEVQPPPPVEARVPEMANVQGEILTHTISIPGETLGLIAKWYSGDSNNWAKIRDANPGVVPERLRIGQQLQIPPSLTIRRDPMTVDFVKKEFAALSKLAVANGSNSVPTVPTSIATEKVAGTNSSPVAVQDAVKDSGRSDRDRTLALDALGGSDSSKGTIPVVSATKTSELENPLSGPAPTGVVFDEDSKSQVEDLQKLNSGSPNVGNEIAGTKNAKEEEDAERQKLLRELLGGR